MSPTFRIFAVSLFFLLVAWVLTGCVQQNQVRSESYQLGDECYRDAGVSSCEILLKINFNE